MTVVFAVAVQPPTLDTVTVYVVVTEGVTPVGFWFKDENPGGADDQLNA